MAGAGRAGRDARAQAEGTARAPAGRWLTVWLAAVMVAAAHGANESPTLAVPADVEVRPARDFAVEVAATDPNPDPDDAERSEPVRLQAEVELADGQTQPAWLEPAWETTYGENPALVVEATAAADAQPATYRITVLATDRRGLSTSGAFDLDVLGPRCTAAVEYAPNATDPCAACAENEMPDVSKTACEACAADTGRDADATSCTACAEDQFSSAGSACEAKNEAPSFATQTATKTVAEDAAAGTALGGALTATDPENDTLTYTLTDASGRFAAEAGTALLKVADGRRLDHEAAARHELTLDVTDDMNERREPDASADDVLAVTVNVTDVDEPPGRPMPPTVVATGPSSLAVAWTAATTTGPPVARYEVRYGKASGGGATDIDQHCTTLSPCTLTATISGLDAYTDYRVRVRAHNDEGRGPPSAWTRAKTFRELTVSYAAATYAVDEGGSVPLALVLDAAADRAVAVPVPTDPRAGFWVSPDPVVFEPGTTRVAAAFSAVEDGDKDDETVALGFGTLPVGVAAGTTATVTVTDTNLNAQPRFPRVLGSRTAAEDLAAGEPLGAAFTADDAEDDPLTYSVLEPAWPFVVDARTGRLRLAEDARLDHEAAARHEVVLRVSDGRDRLGEAEADPVVIDDFMVVTVHVADVDEPPEKPDAPTLTVTGPTSLAATWRAPVNHGPAIERYRVRYRKGRSFGSEDLDFDCTAVPCTLAASLAGLDPGSLYRVRVRAGNDEGRGDYSDWAEASTHKRLPVSYGRASYAVDEGGEVAVMAVLGAAADRPLTIPLTVSPAAGGFSLTPTELVYAVGATSASAVFAAGEDEDRDDETATLGFGALPAGVATQSPETAVVRVTDTGGNAAPSFTAAVVVRSAPEDLAPGIAFGAAVAATDPEGDVLTYSLADPADPFAIDPATGRLALAAGRTLDHESAPSHALTVGVSDGLDARGAADPAVDATVAATVTVTDVDEPPGRPGRPVLAGRSTTSLEVSWTAPDNAGPPIDGYAVQYRVKNVPGTTNAAVACPPPAVCATSLTVTGLDAGTTYEVRVRAANDEGAGRASPWGGGATHRELAASYAEAAYAVAAGGSVAVEVRLDAAADRALAVPLTADRASLAFDPAAATFAVGGTTAAATLSAAATATSGTAALGFGTLPAGVSAGATATATVSAELDLTVSFGSAAYAVDEGDSATVAVLLDQAADRALTVPLTTDPATGSFTLVPSSVRFAVGADSASAVFTATADAGYADETVALGFGTLPPSVAAGTPSTSTVSVSDRNRPAMFVDPERVVTVPEDVPAGGDLGTPLRATDPDGDVLRFDLPAVAWGIDIDPGTGQLSLVEGWVLDYERRSRIPIHAVVTDGFDGRGRRDGRGDEWSNGLLVVTDVDEPPAVPAAPTAAASGATALSVGWREPANTGPRIDGYVVRHREPGGAATAAAAGCRPSCAHTLAGLSPGTVYEVSVEARNAEGRSGPSAWTSASTGSLAASFGSASYAVAEGGSTTLTVVLEPAAPAALSVPLTVTPPDAGFTVTPSTLAFAAGASAATAVFAAAADADYDDERATVGFGALPKGVAAGSPSTASVAVSDGNGPPSFGVGEATFTVAEDLAAGAAVGTLAATDPDGDAVSYAVVPADLFAVDGAGRLTLRAGAALDHETARSHELTLQATDNRDADGVADPAVDDAVAVTVRVTDVDEPPAVPAAPTAAASGATALSVGWREPANTGPRIDGYVVRHREPGGAATATATAAAAGCRPSCAHTLSGLSPGTVYEVSVEARNAEGRSGPSAWTSASTGSLAASFGSASYAVAEGGSTTLTVVLEPAAPAALSVPLTVTPPDAGFTVTPSTLAFAAGATAATAVFAAAADADYDDERATVGFGALPKGVAAGSPSTAAVAVSDGNGPPSFGVGEATFTVAEDLAAGAAVGTLAATDPDGDAVSYAVVPADLFAVDGAGRLTLRAGAALDHETARSHELTLQATDNRDADGAADPAVDDAVAVTVRVTDVDEAPSFGGATVADRSYTAGVAAEPATLPAATGGDTAPVYALAPALPAGLSFDPATRVLGGTPTAASATAAYAYTATDGDGTAATADDDTATLTFAITVAAAPCAAETADLCALSAAASGSSGGGCAPGSSGACAYACAGGTWTETTNTCAADRTLTVSPPPSGGTVSGTGINCGTAGADCAETLAHGTRMALSATADAGRRLTGWTGACSSANAASACTVVLDADRTVGATFCTPTDCTWGAWSACTATACGQEGTRTRSRSGPSCGGAACVGGGTESCTGSTCASGEYCSADQCRSLNCMATTSGGCRLSATDHDSTGYGSCTTGYGSGSCSASCSFGGFATPSPGCVPLDCAVGTPGGCSLSATDDGSWASGTCGTDLYKPGTCRYRCSLGAFRSPTATCVPRDCDAETVAGCGLQATVHDGTDTGTCSTGRYKPGTCGYQCSLGTFMYPTATCVPKDCDGTTVAGCGLDATVHDGWDTGRCDTATHDSGTCRYRCGFGDFGNPTKTCVPKDCAGTTVAGCGLDATVHDGWDTGRCDTATHDSGTCRYRCGFGDFGNPTKTCVPKDCDGTTVAGCGLDATVHGSTGDGSCGAGYEAGSCSASCSFGSFAAASPACVPEGCDGATVAGCELDATVHDGWDTGRCDTETHDSGTCRYRCGFGDFGNPTKTCVPKDCGKAGRNGCELPATDHGSTGDGMCGAGYGAGSCSASCSFGSFAAASPACVPEDCDGATVAGCELDATMHDGWDTGRCDTATHDSGTCRYRCGFGDFGNPTKTCTPKDCDGTTVAGCELDATDHGSTGDGSCGAGYEGSCSASCSFGSFAAPSPRACRRTAPAPRSRAATWTRRCTTGGTRGDATPRRTTPAPAATVAASATSGTRPRRACRRTATAPRLPAASWTRRITGARATGRATPATWVPARRRAASGASPRRRRRACRRTAPRPPRRTACFRRRRTAARAPVPAPKATSPERARRRAASGTSGSRRRNVLSSRASRAPRRRGRGASAAGRARPRRARRSTAVPSAWRTPPDRWSAQRRSPARTGRGARRPGPRAAVCWGRPGCRRCRCGRARARATPGARRTRIRARRRRTAPGASCRARTGSTRAACGARRTRTGRATRTRRWRATATTAPRVRCASNLRRGGGRAAGGGAGPGGVGGDAAGRLRRRRRRGRAAARRGRRLALLRAAGGRGGRGGVGAGAADAQAGVALDRDRGLRRRRPRRTCCCGARTGRGRTTRWTAAGCATRVAAGRTCRAGGSGGGRRPGTSTATAGTTCCCAARTAPGRTTRWTAGGCWPRSAAGRTCRGIRRGGRRRRGTSTATAGTTCCCATRTGAGGGIRCAAGGWRRRARRTRGFRRTGRGGSRRRRTSTATATRTCCCAAPAGAGGWRGSTAAGPRRRRARGWRRGCAGGCRVSATWTATAPPTFCCATTTAAGVRRGRRAARLRWRSVCRAGPVGGRRAARCACRTRCCARRWRRRWAGRRRSRSRDATWRGWRNCGGAAIGRAGNRRSPT